MTTYNVHLYREMRLDFGGIEADTPEAAAAIATGKWVQSVWLQGCDAHAASGT
jgi:hypothetical protein